MRSYYVAHWPGREFKGIYHLLEDTVYLYQPGQNERIQDAAAIKGLNNPELKSLLVTL